MLDLGDTKCISVSVVMGMFNLCTKKPGWKWQKKQKSQIFVWLRWKSQCIERQNAIETDSAKKP